MMKLIHGVILSLAISVWASPAPAKQAADMVVCGDGSTSKKGRGACSHHGGVASDEAAAGRKADVPAASGSVRCKDGSTSTAAGRGACSHHGGVVESDSTTAAIPAPKTRAPEPRPANDNATPPASSTRQMPRPKTDVVTEGGSPTAKCKDGTLSYSAHRSGTCSHHGGVAEWLAGAAR